MDIYNIIQTNVFYPALRTKPHFHQINKYYKYERISRSENG